MHRAVVGCVGGGSTKCAPQQQRDQRSQLSAGRRVEAQTRSFCKAVTLRADGETTNEQSGEHGGADRVRWPRRPRHGGRSGHPE